MFGRLSGTLIEKTPPQIMVDVHGVGYLLEVPMSSFYDLPSIGEPVTLLTQFVVREDAQLLYGFLTLAEKQAFIQLVKISGIGPRTALAVLSGLSVAELAQAVSSQESTRLTKVPGIGKKTAERLLLELKGKLAPEFSSPNSSLTAVQTTPNEIITALLALGYSEKEAIPAVRQLPEGLGVSAGIRQALQILGGSK